MSSNLEPNKIFAAILVAGITASLTGILSHEIFKKEPLKTDAYKIQGVADAGASAAPAAPVGPEPVLALLAKADIAKGEQISRICSACHNLSKGGPNAIGPNLYGVVGRPKGSHPGYSYSKGMEAKGGNWTLSDLNHFLWKPGWYVNGTKMTFVGLKKAQDRADIIAYLRTLSASPVPLPSKADIAKEEAELAPPKPAEAKPAEKAGDKTDNKAAEKTPPKEGEPAKK